MTVEKPWWQSRAIWGSLIVLVAQMARMFDVAIDVEAWTNIAVELATILGAMMAWYGRVRAQAPIDMKRIAPGIELIP